MSRSVIFHLISSGVPVSWSVESLSKSYGIATNSARSWYERSLDRDEDGGIVRDSPHFLCEIEGDEETGFTVKRSDIWFDEHNLKRQSHDQPKWLIQWHMAPASVSEAMQKTVHDALLAKLVGIGYMIPRAEWERRYPSQALTIARFAEFNRHHDAHGGEYEFDLRWGPFMEAPRGFEYPYKVEDGRILKRGYAPEWVPFEDAALPEGKADDIARLLNGGWTPVEIAVLLTKEPVEA